MERNKRKYAIMTIAGIAIVLVLIIAGSFTYKNIIIPNNIYKNAQNLYEAGEYEQAKKVFSSLGNFKDAEKCIQECDIQMVEAVNKKKYDAAMEKMQTGDYKNAIIEFEALGTYSDSEEQVENTKKMKYNYGLAKMESGDFEGAIKEFEELGTYSDSKEQVKNAKKMEYEDGLAKMESGDFEGAIKEFEALGTYSDSKEQLDHARNVKRASDFAKLQTEDNSGSVKEYNPQITEDNSKVTWSCLWFGSYPQAEVVPSGKYRTVDSAYLEDGDIIQDDELYADLKKAKGWDKQKNIILNGEKYRRIRRYETIHWSTESDFSWEDSEIYHYFKYEPIKWRILDMNGDKALILADKALDDFPYNVKYENVPWESSSIRNFLNGYGEYSKGVPGTGYNFFMTAFDNDQQDAIKKSKVTQSDSLFITSKSARGDDTEDKIFLLSDSDVYGTDKAESYGFSFSRFASDKARKCKSSTYAKAMGVMAYKANLPNSDSADKGNCQWWLRSPGDDSDFAKNGWDIECCAMTMGSDGVVYSGYYINTDQNGVRPALTLNLKSTCYSYAGTVCSDGTADELK